MKVVLQRRHVTRPEDYESVELLARVEVDSDSKEDADYFQGDGVDLGRMLSADLDAILDTDVDRALRLDSKYTVDSHLWVFYGRD